MIQCGSLWISPRSMAPGAYEKTFLSDDTTKGRCVTTIPFTSPFPSVPRVLTWFSAVDLGGDAGYGAKVTVETVTTAGVEVCVTAIAAEHVVWGVAVAYVAYVGDAMRHGIVRPSRFPVATGKAGVAGTKTTVAFDTAFPKGAMVRGVLGITEIGLGASYDGRFSVAAEAIKEKGFSLVARTWDRSEIEQLAVGYFFYDESMGGVLSGVAKFGRDLPTFALHDGGGSRQVTREIAFDKGASLGVPIVITGLTGLACNSAVADVRVATDVDALTSSGAFVSMSTWADTKIESGMLSWLAVGDRSKKVPKKSTGVPEKKEPKKKASAKIAAKVADDEGSSTSSEDFEAPKKKAKTGPPGGKKKKVASAASGAGDDDSDSEGKCVVCFAANINAVFVPCGHECCCTTCALHLKKMPKKECPMCKKKIKQVVRTFHA